MNSPGECCDVLVVRIIHRDMYCNCCTNWIIKLHTIAYCRVNWSFCHRNNLSTAVSNYKKIIDSITRMRINWIIVMKAIKLNWIAQHVATIEENGNKKTIIDLLHQGSRYLTILFCRRYEHSAQNFWHMPIFKLAFEFRIATCDASSLE